MALALILNYEEILSWVCFMGLPQREKEEEEIVVVLLKDLMNVLPDRHEYFCHKIQIFLVICRVQFANKMFYCY